MRASPVPASSGVPKCLVVLGGGAEVGQIPARVKAGSGVVLVHAHALLRSERELLEKTYPGLTCVTLPKGSDQDLYRDDETVQAKIRRVSADYGISDFVEVYYPLILINLVKFQRNESAARIIRGRIGRVEELVVCEGVNVCSKPWLDAYPEAVVRQVVPTVPLIAAQDQKPAASPASSSVGGGATGVAEQSPATGARLAIIDKGPFRRCRYKLPAGHFLELAKVRTADTWIGTVRFLFSAPAWTLLFQTVRAAANRRELTGVGIVVPTPGVLARGMLAHWKAYARLHYARRRVKALIMPIHGYSNRHAMIARHLGLAVICVQDGYLPENYPLSTYHPLRQSRWLWWTEKARAWGASWGARGNVYEPARAAPAARLAGDDCKKRGNTLVLCTHGGEWTCLVSRSDIDAFIQGVLECAKRQPGLNFRIRFHPTMDNPMHDGPDAARRVAALVAEAGLPNAALSRESLDADIAWGDIAVTEYSQTIFDFADRKGGNCIIFNPTGRRSFIALDDLDGAVYASTTDGLGEVLAHMARHFNPVRLKTGVNEGADLAIIANQLLGEK